MARLFCACIKFKVDERNSVVCFYTETLGKVKLGKHNHVVVVLL